MTTSSTVFGVAKRLLAEIETELAAVGNGVNVAAVYPAVIPWDACDCGTLAVAVQRQYLTDSFPVVTETAIPCQGGFVAADLTVQVLRCAPTPDGRSGTPSVQTLEAAADVSITDAWVVLSKLQCVLAELEDEGMIVQYVVRPQIFAGPAGGCVGSIVGATIGVEQTNLG